LKKLFLLAFIFLGLACVQHKASASYSQPISSGYFYYDSGRKFTTDDGATFTATTNIDPYVYATSTAILEPGTATITSISLRMADVTASGDVPQFQVGCVDHVNQYHYGTFTASGSLIGTTMQVVNLTGAVACDYATFVSFGWTWYIDIGHFHISGVNYKIADGIGVYDSTFGMRENYSLQFAIDGTLSDFGIKFYPSFENAVTPDFTNWQALIAAPSSTTPHILVAYGLASTTDWAINQGHDSYYFTEPLGFDYPPDFSVGQTFLKSHNLEPGDYKAQLYLNDNATGSNLASSSVITFTITTGTPVYVPSIPDAPVFTKFICNPTDFSIFSVDFGQGMCILIRNLFIPDRPKIFINATATKIDIR